MPVFEYIALDSRGKTTSGIIDAEGAQAARQKLEDAVEGRIGWGTSGRAVTGQQEHTVELAVRHQWGEHGGRAVLARQAGQWPQSA